MKKHTRQKNKTRQNRKTACTFGCPCMCIEPSIVLDFKPVFYNALMCS